MNWRKSTASGDTNCAEVAYDGRVFVRDRTGIVISFTDYEWIAFLEGVKNGEFEVSILKEG